MQHANMSFQGYFHIHYIRPDNNMLLDGFMLTIGVVLSRLSAVKGGVRRWAKMPRYYYMQCITSLLAGLGPWAWYDL
jgi:hypothetical protein